MPSSKYIDKSHDYIPDYNPERKVGYEVKLVPRVNENKNLVSFDQWLDQNEEHLYQIYTMIQEACRSTGRQVFDSDTCKFTSFCKIAYDNSYKYKKHDTNYNAEELDDTVVF